MAGVNGRADDGDLMHAHVHDEEEHGDVSAHEAPSLPLRGGVDDGDLCGCGRGRVPLLHGNACGYDVPP